MSTSKKPGESSLKHLKKGADFFEDQLGASEAPFRAMIEAVTDFAIVMLDCDGRIVTWNTGAQKINGHTPSEVIGKHFSLLYLKHEVDRGRTEHQLELAAENGRYEEEGWRVKKDGTKFWANVIITPVRDSDQNVVGFCKITRDLTQRKHGEETLRRNEELYRTLVEGVSDYAIFRLDKQGHILSWNKGAQKINQYSSDEIIGKHFSIFYTPEDIKRNHPAGELAIASKTGRYEEEGWRVKKDGTKFWANVVITRLADQNGEVIGFAKLTRDLTERKRGEEELQKTKRDLEIRYAESTRDLKASRDQLSVILEGITEGITVLDRNGNFVFVNESGAKLCGFSSAQEMLNNSAKQIMSHYELFDESGKPLPLTNLPGRRVLSGEKNPPEILVQFKDKISSEVRWSYVSAAPVYDAKGEVVQAISIFRDVTERRKNDEEIRKSEQRFRSLADAIPQIVWTSTPDGVVDYTNKRGLDYLGIEEGRLFLGWDHYLHPQDAEKAISAWDDARNAGTLFSAEYRLKRRDGAYRWFLAQAVPVFDSDRNVVKWFGTATDVEEQKITSEGYRFLAEASKLLTLSLNYEETLKEVTLLAVPELADWVSVAIKTDKGLETLAIAHVNPDKVKWAWELERKFPPDQEAPQGAPYVAKTGKSELYPSLSNELLRSAAVDEEHWRIIQEIGFRSVMIVPLTSHGRVLGVLTFVTAESSREYSHHDLEIAEELGRRAGDAIFNSRLYLEATTAIRSRDEFMSIAAHELRTPISALLLQIGLMKRYIIPSKVEVSMERLAKIAETCYRQGEQLSTLVDELLDLTRIEQGKLVLVKEPTDLSAVIEGIAARFKPVAMSVGVDLSFQVPERLVADIDRIRIEQVLTNLISNALKYGERKPILLTLSKTNDSVLITVEDEGPGIPMVDRGKIFEKFERLVSGEHISGLGLGLYIVRQIIQAHKGKIEVLPHSKTGRGSKFAVTIPLK